MLAIFHVSCISEDGQDSVTLSAYASSDLISEHISGEVCFSLQDFGEVAEVKIMKMNFGVIRCDCSVARRSGSYHICLAHSCCFSDASFVMETPPGPSTNNYFGAGRHGSTVKIGPSFRNQSFFS